MIKTALGVFLVVLLVIGFVLLFPWKVVITGTVAADEPVGTVSLRVNIFDASGTKMRSQKVLTLARDEKFSVEVPAHATVFFIAQAYSGEKFFRTMQKISVKKQNESVSLALEAVKPKMDTYTGKTVVLSGVIRYRTTEYNGFFDVSVMSESDLSKKRENIAPPMTAKKAFSAVNGVSEFKIEIPAEMGMARICVTARNAPPGPPFCRDIYNIKTSDIENIVLEF